MDPIAKQIAHDVDSGKYFVEAREWYNKLFVRPANECALMYIYAICAFIICSVIFYNLYSVYPGTVRLTIVTKLADTIDYYPKLKRMHGDYKLGVAEFIAKRYVEAKEAYSPEQFKQDYIFVYRNSSKQVFDEYNKFISTSNPYSPLVLYGWRGKITIDIEQVTHGKKNNLIVRFARKGHDNYNRLLFVQNLEAQINYIIGDIDFESKSTSRIYFKVQDYILREIKTRKDAK